MSSSNGGGVLRGNGEPNAASTGVLTTIDAVAFTDEMVLPKLPPATKLPSLTVHPTRWSNRLGVDNALLRGAAAAADRVDVPEDWSCCAFAGDRGMLHPELTASATAEVRVLDAAAHASLDRTCELGITRATGTPCRHVLEVLEDALASTT